MGLRQVGAVGLDALGWARARRLAQWLEAVLGQSKALDHSVRRQMEGFFGYNLEDVRVHDSRQAGEVARRLGAEAFVVGSRIFAAAESLNTLTPEGIGLMAHELTHVIQQTQPQPIPRSNPVVSQPVPVGEQSIPRDGEAPQFAGYSPPSASPIEGPMEAEAQASEQVVRQDAERGEQVAAASPKINVDKLADRVYRLMQQDLILGRERKVGIE